MKHYHWILLKWNGWSIATKTMLCTSISLRRLQNQVFYTGTCHISWKTSMVQHSKPKISYYQDYNIWIIRHFLMQPINQPTNQPCHNKEGEEDIGHSNKGRFTLWTMKSSHGRLSDVIGRWSHPWTTWVYTKEKMAKWPRRLRSSKYNFLSLLYPLPWSNGFSVGTSKRGGLGKLARAHVINLPF